MYLKRQKKHILRSNRVKRKGTDIHYGSRPAAEDVSNDEMKRISSTFLEELLLRIDTST